MNREDVEKDSSDAPARPVVHYSSGGRGKSPIVRIELRTISTEVPEGVAPGIHAVLPDAPPPSQTFFDGYAAALWGTMLGISIMYILCTLVFLDIHATGRMLPVALTILTVLSLPGCAFHVWYRKRFHRIQDAKHFFKAFLLAVLLAVFMFMIVPGTVWLLILASRFDSMREELPDVARKAFTPLKSMFDVFGDYGHQAA